MSRQHRQLRGISSAERSLLMAAQREHPGIRKHHYAILVSGLVKANEKTGTRIASMAKSLVPVSGQTSAVRLEC